MLRSIAKSVRGTEFVWRYGSNLSPSLTFALGKRAVLNPVEKRVLADLDRDGIAVTSIDELFDNDSEFLKLEKRTVEILRSRRDEISRLGSEAQSEVRIGSKTFNIELLGSEVEFDPDDICARIALEQRVLNVANSYLRMNARLRYYNIWYTFATKMSARESQLWHFDREDNYILKLFLYLRDVDEGTGPFTYAPGTHRRGAYWNRQPEYFFEDNVRRSTDEQMSAVIPKDNWITATGKKGTIVFADTRGFHKGGEARTQDRLMFTCMFTSPGSDSRELLRYPPTMDLSGLSKIQRNAVESR